MLNILKKDLHEFVAQVLCRAGLEEAPANTVARHLVLANLRGVDSHGVSRLEIYAKRLECGIMNRQFQYQIIRETPTSALIDGQNSAGIALCTRGIQLAVEKAKQTGIGIVGIKNSNHCGMLADYTMFAAENDCIALATTNAPANMPPWGGSERYFGTNPFSYGIPTTDEMNVIFDMATSVVARGKMIVAGKDKQQIPLGWALNKEGKPTTDPAEALEGLVLPVGGHKGYGIAFMVETLSALFTGAAVGPHLADLYKDLDRPQLVGQFLFAMRVDLFVEMSEFKNRMDRMIAEIKSIPPVEEGGKIYLPGEIEFLRMKDREVHGIPISKDMAAELADLGKRYGITAAFMK